MAEKQNDYVRSAETLSSSLKMSGYKNELTHVAILELKNKLVMTRFHFCNTVHIWK